MDRHFLSGNVGDVTAVWLALTWWCGEEGSEVGWRSAARCHLKNGGPLERWQGAAIDCWSGLTNDVVMSQNFDLLRRFVLQYLEIIRL